MLLTRRAWFETDRTPIESHRPCQREDVQLHCLVLADIDDAPKYELGSIRPLRGHRVDSCQAISCARSATPDLAHCPGKSRRGTGGRIESLLSHVASPTQRR
jgi:hypothetical protein